MHHRTQNLPTSIGTITTHFFLQNSQSIPTNHTFTTLSSKLQETTLRSHWSSQQATNYYNLNFESLSFFLHYKIHNNTTNTLNKINSSLLPINNTTRPHCYIHTHTASITTCIFSCNFIPSTL